MCTTLNLAEDVLIAARHVAQRACLPLGAAVSTLVRRGASVHAPTLSDQSRPILRGRFSLLPVRDEVILGAAHPGSDGQRRHLTLPAMRALLDVNV